MLTNNSLNGPFPDDPPQVEVWLDIGDAVRVGDSVLRVLDTDGEDTMLRVETAAADENDETGWAELPR